MTLCALAFVSGLYCSASVLLASFVFIADRNDVKERQQPPSSTHNEAKAGKDRQTDEYYPSKRNNGQTNTEIERQRQRDREAEAERDRDWGRERETERDGKRCVPDRKVDSKDD